MIIIKNKDVNKSFKNEDDIESLSSEIQIELSNDFQKYINYLDSNNDHKWFSQEVYDKKFQKFAKEHHNYYLKKYKSALKDYFDIKFI